MPPACSLASAKPSSQAITYTLGTPLVCYSRTPKHSYPSYATHTRACIYCPSFPQSHVIMAHTLFSKQCAQQYRPSPYQTFHTSCPQFQTHNTHPPTLHFTTPWVTSHIDEVNNSTSVSHNPPARKLPAQYASQQKPEGPLAHFHQTSLNALNTPGKMYQSTCPVKCAYKAFPMCTITYHSCAISLAQKW